MPGAPPGPFLRAAIAESAQVRRDIKTALDLGIAPTVLWGRESRTVATDLGQWHTPAWMDVDLLLLDLYREWEDGLCPGCGDPLASHAGRSYKDYSAAAVQCPAVIALDKAQAHQARRDGHRDARTDAGRARSWVVGARDWTREYSAWVKKQLTVKGDADG